MYLLETLLEVNHQQYLDRLREAERQRLIRSIEGARSSSKMYRKSVGWLGTQLVNWGIKLQQSSQIPDTGCQEASFKMSMTAH